MDENINNDDEWNLQWENFSTEEWAISESQTESEVEVLNQIKKELITERHNAEAVLSVLKVLTANWEIQKEIFENIREEIQTSYNTLKNTKWLNTKLQNELLDQEVKVKDMLVNARWYFVDLRNIKNNISKIEKNVFNKDASVVKIKKEIEEIHKESNSLKNNIKIIFKQCFTVSKKIDNILVTLKDNKILADGFIKFIRSVNIEAKKNQEEINILLEKGKKSLKLIEEDQRKTATLYTETDKKTKTVFSWYERIFNPWWIKDKIEKIEWKIKENQVLIEQQLSEASSNRLTSSLHKKLRKIEINLNFRKRGTIIIVILLLILSIGSYLISIYISKSKIEHLDYIQLVYPLVFLLGFFVLQYSKTNKFYEEYYFKYISAFWLPAYFELLESKDDEKAIDYLIRSVEKIHTNPTHEINNNSKDNVFDYMIDWMKWMFSNKNIDLHKIIKNLSEEQISDILDFLKNKALKN